MKGHEYRHVADIGMAKAKDSQIVDIAKANNEIIITHDLDYGHLLAFSGESSPSVIIIRTRNTHPNHVFQHLINNWAAMEGPLSEGAIVVLEDSAIRIRILPIK